MPKQPESKHWARKLEQDHESLQHWEVRPIGARNERLARAVIGQPISDELIRQWRMIPNNPAAFNEAHRRHPDPKPVKRLGKGRIRRRRTTKRLGRGRKRATSRRRLPVRRGTGRRRSYRRRRH